MSSQNLDKFTQAYIECALWSSSGPAFGKCPCCGKLALLDKYPEPEFEQVPMCSDEGCGVREMNSEPPLEDNYSIDDISDDAMSKIIADCKKFQQENQELLMQAKYGHSEYHDFEMAGYDFWLTRNGHGAGFWDRDLPDEVGQALTKAAEAYHECNLYPGDDGKLYI